MAEVASMWAIRIFSPRRRERPNAMPGAMGSFILDLSQVLVENIVSSMRSCVGWMGEESGEREWILGDPKCNCGWPIRWHA